MLSLECEYHSNSQLGNKNYSQGGCDPHYLLWLRRSWQTKNILVSSITHLCFCISMHAQSSTPEFSGTQATLVSWASLSQSSKQGLPEASKHQTWIFKKKHTKKTKHQTLYYFFETRELSTYSRSSLEKLHGDREMITVHWEIIFTVPLDELIQMLN